MAWYWWVVLVPCLLYAGTGAFFGALCAIGIIKDWPYNLGNSKNVRYKIWEFFVFTLIGPSWAVRRLLEKACSKFSPR